MKSFIILAFCGVFFLSANAQTAGNPVSTIQSITGKNILKFNITGAVLQNYLLQYERVINNRQSIGFALSIAPNVPLPFKSTLLNKFGSNSDANNAIQSTRYKKYTATLEYRFYLSGKAPKGFYIAPFVRYMNMDQNMDYTFTPSDGKLHTAHLTSQFGGFGAGILLGDQFLIGPHVTLDWWILGPFFGTPLNADFVGTDPQMGDMTDQDIQQVKNDIENVKLPLYKTTATITPNTNTIEAKLTGPYYGIRAFGLSLGYRF